MDKGRSIFVGIFAILLVSIFLIFSVRADSSNTKIYDDLTKTVMIKDASNVDIISATLNTPEIVSSFTMLESLSNYGISVETTGESMPNSNNNNDNSRSSSSSEGDSETTNVYNTYNTVENKENEDETNKDKTIYLNKPGITGGVIGSSLLSSWQIIFVITLIGLVLVVFIISRTVLRIKGNNPIKKK